MKGRGFGRWLRAQAGREDPVGDLARDYLTDCGHRRASTPNGVQADLGREVDWS